MRIMMVSQCTYHESHHQRRRPTLLQSRTRSDEETSSNGTTWKAKKMRCKQIEPAARYPVPFSLPLSLHILAASHPRPAEEQRGKK